MGHNPTCDRDWLSTLGRYPGLIAVGLVKAYQVAVSPWLGARCRFAPSCSAYTVEAIERYGLRRGVWMALRRILRCHPWHAGGWDPVV